MKTNLETPIRNRCRGGATLAVVAAISLALISMMTYSILASLSSFDTQVNAQIKQDFSQKEDAVLTALLHIVPNKAIGAMKRNSANNPDNYTWETIFWEAIATANAEQSISSELLSQLNLENAILANTGDAQIENVIDVVSAPVYTYAEGTNYVNGGNWWEFYMLADANIGPNVPAPLELDYNNYLLDKKFPIITKQKIHNYYYTKGIQLPAEQYPQFNLIQYPDVKFGYKRPGELFVAKRNWWVFSLTFGKASQETTGIPPVTKNYVLSIYEIPSQLPLSASSIMKVGKFADGTSWENVSLTGGIYADKLETEGTVNVQEGSFSARSSITLSDATTVEGQAVDSEFDQMGAREARAIESSSDFYEASIAGNVGKVAFIPLNPGYNFLKRSSDGDPSLRISPTGWKDYTRGANQAQLRLDILEMISLDTQLPTKVKLYYKKTDGSTGQVVYERGVNWPSDLEPGGSTIPFQTDVLDNNRNAVVMHLDRFPDFLSTLPSAADTSVNNSIYVSPLNSGATVQAPSYPSVESDVCITLRGGKDMTAYSKGFSVVTDLRLYIAETLNGVATTAPANSGLTSDDEYYPPISLFAPEKRFGESLILERPINLRGRLSSLKKESSEIFNPMELLTADDKRIDSDMMDADLISLRSPAELPPIHLMNWMVTIEEIH